MSNDHCKFENEHAKLASESRQFSNTCYSTLGLSSLPHAVSQVIGAKD